MTFRQAHKRLDSKMLLCRAFHPVVADWDIQFRGDHSGDLGWFFRITIIEADFPKLRAVEDFIRPHVYGLEHPFDVFAYFNYHLESECPQGSDKWKGW